MKLKKQLIIIALLVPLFVILMSVLHIGKTLEYKTLDWRFVLRGPNPMSDEVFIVAMGDESVSPDALGRWPWRRAYLAAFLSYMQAYSPGSIVFDILFTEPSEDFPGDDEMLAGQASFLNVYFPFYCIPENVEKSSGYKEDLEGENKELVERISLGKASDFRHADFIKAKNLVMPISNFSSVACGSGYVNAVPDEDGITRRIPLVIQYKDYLVSSVAFYAALNHLNIKKENITICPGRFIQLETENGKKIRIPVDSKCQMLVNHAGAFDPANMGLAPFFGVLKSHDLISSGQPAPFDLNKLKNKIMFLGLTATGTSDLRPTPFSPLFPMVGFLATASSNIIERDFMIPVPVWINYLVILMLAFAVSAVTVKYRAIPAVSLNILLLAAFLVFSFLLFKRNYVISVFYPFITVIFSYAGITVYRFTGEEKEKKVIRNMFQRYVSSQVVDVLLEHPETVKLGGQRKWLTVFFSDIRGFTSMSEKLTPEEVVHILNEYLTEMIDIIFKYSGTLDKFMGDAIMAIWGAPAEQKNHAELAVRAAWEMKNKLSLLQQKWEKEGRKKISVGMGINTGDVVVGNMGSSQFSDYTVIGDNVNLAARLEENAGPGQLIISESTYGEVKDIVEVKKLLDMKVKGREKAVSVYEVVNVL